MTNNPYKIVNDYGCGLNKDNKDKDKTLMVIMQNQIQETSHYIYIYVCVDGKPSVVIQKTRMQKRKMC